MRTITEIAEDRVLRNQLPTFVQEGHELIAFSDGDRGDYDTDDTVVVDIHRAHGIRSRVTGTDSYQPTRVSPPEGVSLKRGTPTHGGLHRPVLDIDFDAALLPSSTKGHFHLYLDKPMPWADYAKLIAVLAEVGIIEPGYAAATFDRGYSSVRLPWINKPDEHKTASPLLDLGELL